MMILAELTPDEARALTTARLRTGRTIGELAAEFMRRGGLDDLARDHGAHDDNPLRETGPHSTRAWVA